MIELCVVIGIIMIVSAIAVFQLSPAMQDQRADTAMRQVLEQLRQAREYAVTNRRYEQITFPVVVVNGLTLSEITITQRNSLTVGAGPDQVLSTLPIQTSVAFLVVDAIDTPDGFVNGVPAGPIPTNAIVFGGISNGPVGGMLFDSTGQLVNGATYVPINGTVFLGIAAQAASGRAATVMGTTGRIRGWKNNGTTWFQF